MKLNSVRRFIYAVVFIVSVSFLVLAVYQIYLHNSLLDRFLQNRYRENKNVMNLVKKLEKDILISVAISISQNNSLKDLIKKDDRNRAFFLVKKLWNEYSRELNISEIHIIKEDGTSFVNFVDFGAGFLEEKERYLTTGFRKDVEKSIRTEKPVSTLFVCRYFVGFRSVYPIKDGDRLIGIVSVGKNIESIIPDIKATLGKSSFAVIDINKVKRCLNPEALRDLEEKNPRYNSYILLGNTEHSKSLLRKIDFKKKYFIKRFEDRTYMFSIFPLRNFGDDIVGYIAFQDDISYLKYGFMKSIVNIFFTYAVLLAGIIASIIFFSGRFERKLSDVENITERLSKKDFSVLREYSVEGKEDDLDKLKKQILTMGRELHNYIIELNRRMMKLSEENYKDPLLGILNRRALIKVGNTEIEKAKIRGLPLSVMVIDLDNFKQINDRYGHDVGDKVLKDFVETVKKIISSRDLFFRLGGEEFLIILPGADISKTLEIGEQIREAIEGRDIETEEGKIHYTVSIGIAQMGEEDDIYSVISRADDNLYRAKREGRNRVIG
ncbi:diguanylate cyclase [Persephonella atlantica]|uniref:diguanylate cyclase n=1 Tax=Persephonella atlantica TaxID=2699429 RepID=A0ABS1GK49_9AQUI|nr:diguanylate cyclase [Persephonella atlantica]MBK3333304.1 diguanylate cyclase [Persephonella atlantica]